MLPKGFHSPRVAIDGDRLKLGFRYGEGFWSTVVSVELRVWLVADEVNLMAVEVCDLRAGRLRRRGAVDPRRDRRNGPRLEHRRDVVPAQRQPGRAVPVLRGPAAADVAGADAGGAATGRSSSPGRRRRAATRLGRAAPAVDAARAVSRILAAVAAVASRSRTRPRASRRASSTIDALRARPRATRRCPRPSATRVPRSPRDRPLVVEVQQPVVGVRLGRDRRRPAPGSASSRHARSTGPASSRKSQCGVGQSCSRMTNRGMRCFRTGLRPEWATTGKIREFGDTRDGIMAKAAKKDRRRRRHGEHLPQPPGDARLRDPRPDRVRDRAGRHRGEEPARRAREPRGRLRPHRRRRGVADRRGDPRVRVRQPAEPQAEAAAEAAAAPPRDRQVRRQGVGEGASRSCRCGCTSRTARRRSRLAVAQGQADPRQARVAEEGRRQAGDRPGDGSRESDGQRHGDRP